MCAAAAGSQRTGELGVAPIGRRDKLTTDEQREEYAGRMR